MRKKKKLKQHIINWSSTAHTVVRGSSEPYELGPEYHPTRPGKSWKEAGLEKFTIKKSHSGWTKEALADELD